MGWREAGAALFAPKATHSGTEDRTSYYAPSQQAVMSSAIVPVVTPSTAVQSVAIRSTTDLIASVATELPITVNTGEKSDRRTLPTPSNLEDPGGDGTGREDWGYRLLNSWLYAGNAFGDIVQQKPGMLVTCDLFNPEQISPSIVEGAARWYVNGREVTRPSDFRHWRVNPVAGRLLGLSPIEHHAAIIGVSLATTRFGRAWFTDGSHGNTLLAHDGELDAEQIAIAKARYMASLGTREPIVIAGKWSQDSLQVTNEESQFLQTAGMSEAQCARIFGPGFAEILGYETGQKMTYGNVVDRRQDLLVLGINRWLRRYERVLSLFVPRGQWVEINRDALLEATTLQRFQAHASSLNAGWRTPNEVRLIEGLEAIDGGDKLTPRHAPQTELQGTETGDGNTSGS